ncbi:MAG TPA: efflux RND transporter periplasmic adaptor subunit [Caulobacteraceae bacterium]
MSMDARTTAGRRRRLYGWLALGAAVVLAALGIWSRFNAVSTLKAESDDAAIPRVQVVSATAAPAQRTLVLPGSISAWYEAPIFAQVSGYILHWYKDYGALVKKGDVLATISAPAVDAQFQAARADLATAQARYQLAVVTAQRWAALSGTQAVAQQDVDIKKADAVAQKAEVAAAQQNVARYAAMVAFKTLVAPFDGVVIARNTDIGDYVNAAGGDASLRATATPLFSVADMHALRVFVSVPQEYSTFLAPGLQATLTMPQSPEKQIPAKVLTTANAVRPTSRTVVTELTLPNPNHALWPGTYVDVHFTFPGDAGVLIVPAQALLFRSAGTQVALVEPDNRIHLQDVVLGRNLGTNVEVRSGLTISDRFVANPSLGLLEGQQVRIVQPVKGYQPAQSRAPPAPRADSRPAAPPPFSAKAAAQRAASEPGAGTAP